MSMRGDVISEEYNKMVWVHDREGKEYACYVEDLKGKIKTREQLTDEEKKKCLDLNTVVGDSW
ncbi:hypothetical protein [Desulfocastanea catecholica]